MTIVGKHASPARIRRLRVSDKLINPVLIVAETFLGAWRLLAVQYAVTEGRGTTAGMKTPQRLMFRTAPDDWVSRLERRIVTRASADVYVQRDHAKLTSWFISTIMPDSHVESRMVWQDRAESQTTFVFDRITITDVSCEYDKGRIEDTVGSLSRDPFDSALRLIGLED